MTQYLVGDNDELLFHNVVKKYSAVYQAGLIAMFANCYNDQALGQVLYNLNQSPLYKAIPESVFIATFNAIFEKWRYVGNFESFITVFKAIFGNETTITFTKTAAGVLTIDVVAKAIYTYPRITLDGSYRITKAGDLRVSKKSIPILDYNQVSYVMQSLTPAGTTTIINFSTT